MAGNSLWAQMRQCNELPGFDTVFPILLMHSVVDIFPACLPPSCFPLPASSPSPSLFQPIRHDSTSWLLANSQPEDIICVCECVCVGGWGCQHIGLWYFLTVLGVFMCVCVRACVWGTLYESSRAMRQKSEHVDLMPWNLSLSDVSHRCVAVTRGWG